MKSHSLILVLLLSAMIVAHAADALVTAPVKLTKTSAIQWDGRSNETIDSLIIAKPVSILLWHCSSVVIAGCDIHSIELAECENITIRNCWIHDSDHPGVEVSKSKNVTVQGCRMESVISGVYAVESKQIQVIGNFVRNVKGPLPRGQLVQFDKVSGEGNVIRGNYAINDQGKSHPEDVISLYASSGTERSPILIEDNYLTGDPARGSAGKSESGSGIMLGDSGGTYLTCRRNTIIDAGQVGIGVAGGSFIRVEDNLIYGHKSNVSNVGLYIWNQSGVPSGHVAIIRNRVYWLSRSGEDNSWWDGGGVQEVELRDNQFVDSALERALPTPPSRAPIPPQPWLTKNPDGILVARLPWKTNE